MRVHDLRAGHEGEPVSGVENLSRPFDVLGDTRCGGNGCSRQTDIRMHEHTLSNAQTAWRSAGGRASNAADVSGPAIRGAVADPIHREW